MTEQLYLIAHKVRGKLAFDVAERMEMPPGPAWWIIPTSGHRAYPFWHAPIEPTDVPPIPAGLQDHYACNDLLKTVNRAMAPRPEDL